MKVDKPGHWALRVIALAALVLLSLGFLSLTPVSAQQRQQSSIIIDAQSRAVLYAEDPDGRRYPASLTKIMTLYLVFEALDRGRLRLDQYLPISSYAAAQAPSVLGLRPGSTIRVEDAILGVATKSANDASVVLAEAIAGSEDAFAEQMTVKARLLGMSNTTFRNAHGLPNPQQQTTARDMATLALALINNHPRRYHYFSTREFTYEGRVYSNHNKLLGQYDGTDGIKTGFINASGFNLVASSKRDGRRLVGVVFGGNTGRERDREMMRLLDAGFSGRVIEEPEIRTASIARSTGRKVAQALNPIKSAQAGDLSRTADQGSADILKTLGVQVGAYSRANAAEQEARKAIGNTKALNATKAVPVASRDDQGKLFRARVGNLSEAEARDACRQLHRQQQKCIVIPPLS